MPSKICCLMQSHCPVQLASVAQLPHPVHLHWPTVILGRLSGPHTSNYFILSHCSVQNVSLAPLSYSVHLHGHTILLGCLAWPPISNPTYLYGPSPPVVPLSLPTSLCSSTVIFTSTTRTHCSFRLFLWPSMSHLII